MSTSGFGLWHTLSEEKFAPVHLTAVSVNVSTINLVAEVEVVQNYFNEANHAIKAVYKFPLTEGKYFISCLNITLILNVPYNVLLFSSQPGAGICKFSAEVDGREIKSVVKEKVDEETDYDEATRREPTAFMIKEKRPDIFMVMINVGFNIKKRTIINKTFQFCRSKLEMYQPNRTSSFV